MPEIVAEKFQNTVLRQVGDLGEQACQVMAVAINAVDPYICVKSHLDLSGSILTINHTRIDLNEISRIYLLGLGKASVPMAMAVLDDLGDRVDGALVVTKDKKFLAQKGYQDKLVVYQGAHPVPDERSINATKAVLSNLPQLNADDLVIVVISGGGSALFTNPIEGVSLGDLQELTTLLLRSGADIQEINTIRKHLDRVKGGRLSTLLAPAQIQTLILSDVIGDDLDMIASGPTTADSTTYADAWRIMQKYDLTDVVPLSVKTAIIKGLEGELPETVKPSQMLELKTQNHLVGTNQLAGEAAQARAEQLGFETEILTTTLTGLTEEVASGFADLVDQMIEKRKESDAPICLIMGGETTVDVRGDGLGGRNQDLAMRMAPVLAGKSGVLFISLATDGEDGPTDAAGGVMTGDVLREGVEGQDLDVAAYIANSDAYNYLKKTGALIKIGATGTNVNDLILMFFDKSSD